MKVLTRVPFMNYRTCRFKRIEETNTKIVISNHGINLKSTKMKKMTCRQLGGACEKEFVASTFDEMAEMSKEHGREMFEQGDTDHLQAMQQMQELMKSPVAMQEWFESKRKEFEALPEMG